MSENRAYRWRAANLGQTLSLVDRMCDQPYGPPEIDRGRGRRTTGSDGPSKSRSEWSGRGGPRQRRTLGREHVSPPMEANPQAVGTVRPNTGTRPAGGGPTKAGHVFQSVGGVCGVRWETVLTSVYAQSAHPGSPVTAPARAGGGGGGGWGGSWVVAGSTGGPTQRAGPVARTVGLAQRAHSWSSVFARENAHL